MSGSTAELTAIDVSAPRKFSAAAVPRSLSGGRLYLAFAAGALLIGLLSLLIPSTPSYDPWSWLVWGREIVHLDLHTTGGPTWKPLPVIFTTLFAPFGSAAPDMWLVVARAGAVMASLMVFRLAWRVVVGLGSALSLGTDDAAARRRLVLGPALLAGVLAFISLSFSDSFITDNALGYSEGLMTALVLIAVDLHLDGHPRAAFAVGFAAALDRPEIWLFWGPYGLWLFWKHPEARKLVIALFVLVPVLWFVPEYWGSGHFFRGVSRAQHVRSNSPALKPCPFCSLIVDHAWPKVLLRIKGVAAVAVGIAILLLLRRWRAGQRRLENDRDRGLALLVLCGLLGFGWWVLIGLMTQAGFSGNDRYLVLGAAFINIAGAAGWGWAALELGGVLRRRFTGRSASGLVWSSVALFALLFAFVPNWVATNLNDLQKTHRALVYQAQLRASAAAAVTKLGGASKLFACGSVQTEGFQVPMLAYQLGVRTSYVQASPLTREEAGPPPNVIFQARAQRHAHLLPSLSNWPTTPYTLVLHNKRFKVYEHCNA